MEGKLASLVERLQAAFGDRLISVVLYGSAATGDWQLHSSNSGKRKSSRVTVSPLVKCLESYRRLHCRVADDLTYKASRKCVCASGLSVILDSIEGVK